MKALLRALPPIAFCLLGPACREKQAPLSVEAPRWEPVERAEPDRELEYLTGLSRPSPDRDEESRRPLLFSSTIEGREITPGGAERLRDGELDYMEDLAEAVDPMRRREAVEDLISKIAIPRELPAKIGGFRLIPAAELAEALEKIGKETNSASEWWAAFAHRFPEHRGILTFSRIGFSKDGTVAVFRSGLSTGPLGGDYGTFFAIKLANGDWVTVAELRGTRMCS